eukprot:1869112-Prymnesium_polylepis.1
MPHDRRSTAEACERQARALQAASARTEMERLPDRATPFRAVCVFWMARTHTVQRHKSSHRRYK